MSAIAVIPAKGSSRRVPGKNLHELGGRPLVAWTIEAALKSVELERVVLSTDDPCIAQVGRDLGCEVLVRPDALAADGVEAPAVVLHALQTLEPGPEIDTVVMLLPTSPFRSAAQIDNCVHLARFTGMGIVSACERFVFTMSAPGVAKTPAPNGAIWVANRSQLVHDGYFRPSQFYVMDEVTGLDIDHPHEFAAAEAIAAGPASGYQPRGRRFDVTAWSMPS